MSERGLVKWSGFLACGLLALYAWQAAPGVTRMAPTFDEPAHIGAGLSYLKTGDFKINLQHPPLLKDIAAVPLILGGIAWPIQERDWIEAGPDPVPFLQWEVGSSVIYGNDPDRVMLLARAPFLLLTILLGAAIFAWGREMLGPFAALAATFLFVLDPAIVAHGVIVTTDTGFALGAVLTVWTLWRWLQHRTLARLFLCGAALGVALAAKFTGVLFVALTAGLVFAAIRWIPAAVQRRPSTLIDPYAGEDRLPRAVWCLYALAALLVVAGLVVWASYLFRSPTLYFTGLARVNADHDPNYWPYMAGTFKPQFWTYYLVAYMLKEPLPSILLAIAGVIVLLRRRVVTAMDRAFVLVPPAALFFFYTFLSHNRGFRYLIPALPFLHLAGGVGAKALWESPSPLKKGALAVLCAWLGFNAWGISPDHLTFFNESACLMTSPGRLGRDAGTACGPLWLDDSNVDWGQGVKELAAWLRANAPGHRIGLAYFGTARPDVYGIEFDRLGSDDLMRGLPIGLSAISTHLWARTHGQLQARFGDGPQNWMAHREPKAIVGHAYYVYEVIPAANP
ncbi:MAG TPA: glycosyltransferase family 39 protein [Candidatus Polarisedimenticolia bacterium]|nr:glycosyltransferase family 39 protein [Candidatus Polarisedimenticolia bacterium]